MTKAVQAPPKSLPAKRSARSRTGPVTPAFITPAKDTRAPVQILTSTKEWLDQIISEQDLRSYDEAIMFLITERQKYLPSDFGVYSDLEEYVCKGED